MSWGIIIGIAWLTLLVVMGIKIANDEKNQTEEQKAKSKKFRERLDYKHPDKH